MFNGSVKHKLSSLARPYLAVSSSSILRRSSELYGLAGFDFIIVDAEHGAYTYAGIENIVRTCEGAGMSSIIHPRCR